MDSQLLDKLTQIEEEYLRVEKEMSDPEVYNDVNKYLLLQRLENKYKPIYDEYNNYKSVDKDINDLNEIIRLETNKEAIESYKKLLEENEIKLKNILEKIDDLLIEKDPNDSRNAIIEIKGKVGGEEANLFASNLFEMYVKFANKNNFKIEINDKLVSEKGGYSFISFFIIGQGAYGLYKYESGIHRVQRIPLTESKDKLQTSTASVYVIPEADEEDIKIDPLELRIDTYRSSGAGGQHVNTTDSAVRITHIPTGLVSSSQDGRSQHDNKDRAMKALISKINNLKLLEARKNESEVKRRILGTGERSEKIRTYNYPENRITDHRINLKIKKLDQILNGELEQVITPLRRAYR